MVATLVCFGHLDAIFNRSNKAGNGLGMMYLRVYSEDVPMRKLSIIGYVTHSFVTRNTSEVYGGASKT